MRGIFLVGVLQSFADRNYFPWKLVIGSSAGALTGAAYTARQIHHARDAYFTSLLSKNFINISNVLSRERSVLNLDWMVELFLRGEDRFDIKKLKKGSRILITATDCKPGVEPSTVYLNSKKDDIATALKASAAIPVLYKNFIIYKNYRLLDGGLLDPIPFMKAISMGFRPKDILVVVTRPRGYRKKRESFWIRKLYETYFKNVEYRSLVKSLENRYIEYNKILDMLENTYKDIDVIYPPDDFPVDRLTRDNRKILEGFEDGIESGRKYLLRERYISKKIKDIIPWDPE